MKKRLNETAEKFAEIVKKFDSRSENACGDNQQVNEGSFQQGFKFPTSSLGHHLCIVYASIFPRKQG